MISPLKNSVLIEQAFETFFRYVKKLVDIPFEDQIRCRAIFQPFFIKKDFMLEVAGTIPKYHNFIVAGHIRNFYNDKNGDDITTDINDGPRFITPYSNFFYQTVSSENLHCITDCIVLRISYEDAFNATNTGITSREYFEKSLLYHLEKSKIRMNDLKTKSGKERYEKLLFEEPEIIKNVPLRYIASYLGLNPGSISRIRKELCL